LLERGGGHGDIERVHCGELRTERRREEFN